MSATPHSGDRRPYRLATNDNEIVNEEVFDTEGHRLAANDNETTVDDEIDTEGHRLASNANETTVERPRTEARGAQTGSQGRPGR